MKLVITLLTILTITSNLSAKTDEFRSAYARSVKEQLNVPVDYGHVTLTTVMHVAELDTFAYGYRGQPDKNAVAKQSDSFWAGSDGAELRKYGFRDAIYIFGDVDKEYGVYSCAEKKWYSGITSYCKTKGLPE